MYIPKLIDVIDANVMGKWREEIEKKDTCGFGKSILEIKRQLTENLDDEHKKLAYSLEIAVNNHLDYIYFEVCNLLFYFAFKEGMDFQKAVGVDI